MYYVSTRNNAIRQPLSAAITEGLASDGGLFVPETFPKVDLTKFTADLTYVELAQKILHEFFKDDNLDEKLPALCQEAFTFPVPLEKLNDNTYLLELFHGPTSSFKDFGARFLAGCLNAMAEKKKTTIMVATSGDTGSAVASAFYRKANINVIILYPDQQISERQQHQITCWDDNILALAVEGTFDDCQRLVKDAFKDKWWQEQVHLSSANSINIGRLLPQIIYYAYSSLQFYQQHKVPAGYIVPTGNLGNATAGYWAKQMGFPIREIVLATNANQVIEDYLSSGEFHPRPSIATIANAMDVGNPSNFERLRYLFNTFAAFKENVTAFSASDTQIRQTIDEVYKKYHKIICPHTATAFFTREQLSDKPWIVVATADASKFEQTVEPVIHTKVPIAPQLQDMLDKPAKVIKVGNQLLDIQKMVAQYLQ